MRWSSFLPFLAVLANDVDGLLHKRDYDSHDYYAVHLRSGVEPTDLSNYLGLHYEYPLGELEDHHIFRTTERQDGYDHIQTAVEDLRRRRRKREAGAEYPHVLDHVLLTQKQELHKRFPLIKRGLENWERQAGGDAPPISPAAQHGIDLANSLSINDPIFQEQWHLNNILQPGHDINVTGVWQQGITGKNSTVCIVDDGLDLDSDDLRDNYFAKGSYDFNDPGPDPKPRLSDDRHGTRCAGEVAAVRNNVCGVGVAYDGKVSGVRILSKVISDADEAVAMNYAYQDNDIYSCSWGPPDNGQAMEAPGILIKRAMLNGVQKGRRGLGSIYVFAIGNGAANDDNCNYDGYTNSIYSVSVGGIDRKGLHPYYSEKCSAQLVVTYSSGSGDAIHTTDVGKDTCYSNHGGTSAAGPLVAGIYALMLEANPLLSWRDIQWLTVITAVKIDQPAEWQMNVAMGKEFSHQFGYGKADAYALVAAAQDWTSVKPQAWYFSPWLHVRHDIPQGDQGLAASFDVTAGMLKKANLERLEHVTVTMNVEHTRRGDLSVELRSPSGMVSHIATTRRNDAANSGYVDWNFMSVAHWGESGIGQWTVVVKDTNVNEHAGTFTDWRLRLWGESIDAESQDLIPMPTDHDDEDHDDTHTETASVATMTVDVPTETGAPAGNPTDHIDRPVNNKVTSTPDATPSSTSSAQEAAQPTEISLPTPVDEGDKEDEVVDEPAASPTSTSTSNFLPHPFPTFGVSKRTQVWIYGAFGLILVFLAALGTWWCYMRRKQQRWMSRDDYGFEMVEHDDHDNDDGGASAGANGRLLNGKARKQRGGELYDAFRAGSDDEEEPFDLGEDSDGSAEEDGTGHRRSEKGNEKTDRYRDEEPGKERPDVR